MIKLQTGLIWPGCAQGKYIVKAKGYFLAVLRWGTADKPFNGWSPFLYVPIDPAGNGTFFFPGRRAIPREATHVWAHCVNDDFSTAADVSVGIPQRFLCAAAPDSAVQRFSVLTDLHLASKPWHVRQALKTAESDVLFLLGDSTNDGEKAQFDLFQECIRDIAPDKVIFPVPGNHDIVHPKIMPHGTENYRGFQASLLARAAAKGYPAEYHPDSLAYAVRIGRMDVVGLQCVTDGRRFLFPEGKQLTWLQEHLEENRDAARHMILCHAPLLRHNPNRKDGTPYLNRDKELQAILDSHANILFLSGHTHVSPNLMRGNAEWDAERNNIYLDCGSAVIRAEIVSTGNWLSFVKRLSRDEIEKLEWQDYKIQPVLTCYSYVTPLDEKNIFELNFVSQFDVRSAQVIYTDEDEVDHCVQSYSEYDKIDSIWYHDEVIGLHRYCPFMNPQRIKPLRPELPEYENLLPRYMNPSPRSKKR